MRPDPREVKEPRNLGRGFALGQGSRGGALGVLGDHLSPRSKLNPAARSGTPGSARRVAKQPANNRSWNRLSA